MAGIIADGIRECETVYICSIMHDRMGRRVGLLGHAKCFREAGVPFKEPASLRLIISVADRDMAYFRAFSLIYTPCIDPVKEKLCAGEQRIRSQGFFRNPCADHVETVHTVHCFPEMERGQRSLPVRVTRKIHFKYDLDSRRVQGFYHHFQFCD